MKKILPKNLTMDAYILQKVESENPETVEQLVKLVQQKFHCSDEEILKRIAFLQSKGEITLKKKQVTATKVSAYWYWTTLIFTAITVILVLQIPENAYPIVYARYFFGSFFVLLLPGYTLVRALFPTKKLDIIERVGLSIGMSIALACLDAFILNFTPWKITLLPLVLSLSLMIAIFATIAILRERH